MADHQNRFFHRKKIMTIFFVCAAVLCGLLGRLLYLMVWRAEYYEEAATRLHESCLLYTSNANGYDVLTKTDTYFTQEDIDALTDDELLDNLNYLWKNYCISTTYEPGSTAKPFKMCIRDRSGADLRRSGSTGEKTVQGSQGSQNGQDLCQGAGTA